MKIIDKKAVMKRARKIFEGNSKYLDNFSESLKRAWWWVENADASVVAIEILHKCCVISSKFNLTYFFCKSMN